MASTFLKVFLLLGQAGLFITHGSMRIDLPEGVSIWNVACPSQVILFPFRSIKVGLLQEAAGYLPVMEVSNILLKQLESVIKARNKRAASSQQLLRFPGGPAADERVDILEPHLLQHPGSKRRAIAASAIKNQLAILIIGDLIYVAFKHTTRNVLCAGNRAALHFVGLTHIDQFEVLAALLHGLKRRDIDLLNLTLGF